MAAALQSFSGAVVGALAPLAAKEAKMEAALEADRQLTQAYINPENGDQVPGETPGADEPPDNHKARHDFHVKYGIDPVNAKLSNIDQLKVNGLPAIQKNFEEKLTALEANGYKIPTGAQDADGNPELIDMPEDFVQSLKSTEVAKIDEMIPPNSMDNLAMRKLLYAQVEANSKVLGERLSTYRRKQRETAYKTVGRRQTIEVTDVLTKAGLGGQALFDKLTEYSLQTRNELNADTIGPEDVTQNVLAAVEDYNIETPQQALAIKSMLQESKVNGHKLYDHPSFLNEVGRIEFKANTVLANAEAQQIKNERMQDAGVLAFEKGASFNELKDHLAPIKVEIGNSGKFTKEITTKEMIAEIAATKEAAIRDKYPDYAEEALFPKLVKEFAGTGENSPSIAKILDGFEITQSLDNGDAERVTRWYTAAKAVHNENPLAFNRYVKDKDEQELFTAIDAMIAYNNQHGTVYTPMDAAQRYVANIRNGVTNGVSNWRSEVNEFREDYADKGEMMLNKAVDIADVLMGGIKTDSSQRREVLEHVLERLEKKATTWNGYNLTVPQGEDPTDWSHSVNLFLGQNKRTRDVLGMPENENLRWAMESVWGSGDARLIRLNGGYQLTNELGIQKLDKNNKPIFITDAQIKVFRRTYDEHKRTKGARDIVKARGGQEAPSYSSESRSYWRKGIKYNLDKPRKPDTSKALTADQAKKKGQSSALAKSTRRLEEKFGISRSK